MTLVEVLVACTILSVGLLSLAASGALVTRMIGQGQRSAVAGTFAAQRMERLRIAACIPALRLPGGENLMRGSTALATNTWRFTLVAGTTWKIDLTTTYRTYKNRFRTERMENTVIC